MKIEHIAKTNQKGQIVIPKDLREELGINEEVQLHLVKRGGGIYLYPIKEVIGDFDEVGSFAAILAKTRGSWGPASAEEKRRGKAQRALELKAAKRRREEW